ncbi:hypothetical protein NDI35_28135 [Microcoleus vaginatus FACHB-2002]
MKTKLLRQKTTPIIGKNIKNIDKLTCEQILNFMLKAKNCNQLNPNNMLLPVKNMNTKKLSTPLLLSPRPSKKVSHIAGRRLGDPQSSSEMRSLAGFVLRSEQQSLADRKSRLRSVYEPIYFLGGMKP